MRLRTLLLTTTLLLTGVPALLPARAAAADPDPWSWSWYELDANRKVRVNLYVFWSKDCPHCARANEWLANLRSWHPWLDVKYYEVTTHAPNRELYNRMAASLGLAPGQLPAFFHCRQMDIGFVSRELTGDRLERSLVRCRESLQRHFDNKAVAPPAAPSDAPPAAPPPSPPDPPPTTSVPAPLFLAAVLLAPAAQPAAQPPEPDWPVDLELPREQTVTLPGYGDVQAAEVSLPLLTLVLAGCDAFNPCAFFVLLFLLSLLTHGHSRGRMLLVGGTFVFFSALLYFLFMAAWLNVFFLVGHLRVITLAAGLVAVAVALLNIKDYFWFKQGPSLSIPDSARPGLIQRMTALIGVNRLGPLLAGTAALAIAANLYELLCTSGFPLVYTRVLTLRQLPTATYYLYLLAYNLIYVLPLAAIVLAFTLTLGSRKLSEHEGRTLKLLSGLMMLVLGLILIAQPALLNTVLGALATLGIAVGLTALVVGAGWARRRFGSTGQDSGSRGPRRPARLPQREAATSTPP